jgi:hypothetical protein
MAIMKFIILLVSTVMSFGQDNSVIIQAPIPGTKDVLILINEVDPDLYSGFKITRGKETVFSFNRNTIEIEADNPLLQKANSNGSNFIILKVCGRPSAGWYLYIEQIGSEYEILGETPPCTDEIFGDIDSDGVVEIGLTNPLHEGGWDKEYLNNHYLNNVKVIELRENFTVDEKLTELYVSKMLVK